jgi:glucuronate isomerase
MSFLDDNYLLESDSARQLYDHVRDLPIVDAHNHADIKEIVENKPWSDIWQVEGATDHYVWELMRKRGISEDKITGSASNREKWDALASVFPEFIGNPVYEWVHLDLKRRFGIDDTISSETAGRIWNETKRQLQQEKMRPQQLLESMQVEIMCTTDDPTLSLPYHEQAAAEVKATKILPTWRPDKAMNISKQGWKKFIKQLGKETSDDVSQLSGLLSALQKTHDYFDSVGCVASDHGVQQPHAYKVSEKRAKEIHEKAFKGKDLEPVEVADYKAYMLVQFGEMNKQTGWVTQIHIGPVRDYRDVLWESLGADTGGDISTQNIEFVENLQYFLNKFDDELTIVLYVIDPTHMPTISTIARAFPNISLGAPWWFNDSPYGMETNLKYMATVDLLANHAGMVTDSRKLMSFDSRTEMFRRTLCNVAGDWVEKGQVPLEPAAAIVKSVSYQRPKNLFFKK